METKMEKYNQLGSSPEFGATILPRIMVLQNLSGGYMLYKDEEHIICDNKSSVFDPLAKIAIEKAKTDDSLVHLRFAHSNRYLAVDGNGVVVVARSKEPVEDKSKPSCTLFKVDRLTINGSIVGRLYTLRHVQTGQYLYRANYHSGDGVCVFNDPLWHDAAHWIIKDWELFVKMPEHVAFKGSNCKYLKAVSTEGHPYLQFSSDDPNDGRSGFQITHSKFGPIWIKSDYFNNFWRRSPNWIWADCGVAKDDNDDTLFYPIKIDDNTIALENFGNGNFCIPLSVEGKTNCLNAAISSMSRDARLTVEELVLRREVYDVVYQMDDARVYDLQPYIAGTTTVTNNTDSEGVVSVAITYDDESSYSFTRGVSVTGGVTVSIQANLLGIERGGIEISLEVTGNFEWNNTYTTTKTITATGELPVPARSKAKVNYVGTKGTCDVPYHYTQRYVRSTDGHVFITEEVDGIYLGVNCYDYDFQFEKIDPIDSSESL